MPYWWVPRSDNATAAPLAQFLCPSSESRNCPRPQSCPSCFTTVCTACQQHEVYHDQWRAVFVMNCHANRSRLVQRTRVGSKRGQGVGRTEGGSQGSKRKRRGVGGRGKVDQSARGGERGKASGQGAVGPAGASGGQREGGEESGQDLSQGAGDGPEPGELHPVVCDYCGCELGVFDADEVYHFTSVVPTY